MDAMADSSFRDALIRLRMRDGMFFEIGRGLTFIHAGDLPRGDPASRRGAAGGITRSRRCFSRTGFCWRATSPISNW